MGNLLCMQTIPNRDDGSTLIQTPNTNPLKSSLYDNTLPHNYSVQREEQTGSFLTGFTKNDANVDTWNTALKSKDVPSELGIDESVDLGSSGLKVNEKYPYCSGKLDLRLIKLYESDKTQLRNLVKRGPPKQRYRWSSWQLLIFENYRAININVSHLQTPLSEQNAIQKDIPRTTAQHETYYQCKKGSDQLDKVLQKVVKTFPAFGYCQGLNFLAGFLLLISTNEKQTYDFLVQFLISPKYLIYYIFCEGLPLVNFLEFCTMSHIKNHLPKLHNKIFEELQIENCFWLTKIIMTLFLYCFSNQVCLRFWDYLISHKIFNIVSLICSFLDQNSKEILSFEDKSEFIFWFGDFQQKMIPDKIIEAIIHNAKKFKIDIQQVELYAKLIPQKNKLICRLQTYSRIQEFLDQDIKIIVDVE